MLKVYNVKTEYVNYLRKFDSRVNIPDKGGGSGLSQRNAGKARNR
jgi:hypothetical protein